MTTAATTLVERVRDLVDDFGDAQTTLSSAVTTTDGTSVGITSATEVDAGDYLNIDFEVMRSVSGTTTQTVVRGERGSTAATHLNAAKVIVSPIYPSNRILNMLGAALGKMTKIVVDSSTLTVVDDQYAYALPATIDRLWRVEIENSSETGEFFIIRNWEMQDGGTYFRIFGEYDTTRNIRCVGTSKFSALTSSGNLDTTYPDDNPNAINYLIYEAVGQLLLQRQAKIAGRDSFVGLTDAFGANYPDRSIRDARQYLVEAERYRQLAIRQEPILQTPEAPTQSPTRRYLQRL
jgi:hypothetical protein